MVNAANRDSGDWVSDPKKSDGRAVGFVLLMAVLSLCLLVLSFTADPRECRATSLAGYWANCLWQRGAWMEILPALLEFLSRLAALGGFAIVIAAQFIDRPWARPLKVARLFHRAKDISAAHDDGPLASLIDTVKELCARPTRNPESLALWVRGALTLAASPDAKDREAFEKIGKGKATAIADEIVAKERCAIPRLMLAARLFAPYDLVKAQKTYLRILEADKENREAGLELGHVDLALGERAIDGDDLAQAAKHLKSAGALFKQHGGDKPGEPVRAARARALALASDVAFADQALDRARELGDKASGLYRELASAAPTAPGWQRALVSIERRLAAIAISAGARQQATGHYERALSAAEQLSMIEPRSPEGRLLAIEIQDELADFARATGDLRTAQNHLTAAEKLVAQLPPTRLSQHRDRYARLDRLRRAGSLAVEIGDFAVAQRVFVQAMAAIDRIEAAEPANRALRDDRVHLLKHLGDVCALVGDLTEAQKHYDAALTVLAELQKEAPEHFQRRWDRYLIHVQQMRVAKARGDAQQEKYHDGAADAMITGLMKDHGFNTKIARAFSDFRIARPDPQTNVNLFF